MLTQGNVLTDGGIEQEHILFDVAHFLLELLGRVIPHVSLVIKDLALVAGQPAQKNLQQGALAAAGFSYQTEGFSRLDGKGNAVHRF